MCCGGICCRAWASCSSIWLSCCLLLTIRSTTEEISAQLHCNPLVRVGSPACPPPPPPPLSFPTTPLSAHRRRPRRSMFVVVPCLLSYVTEALLVTLLSALNEPFNRPAVESLPTAVCACSVQQNLLVSQDATRLNSIHQEYSAQGMCNSNSLPLPHPPPQPEHDFGTG